MCSPHHGPEALPALHFSAHIPIFLPPWPQHPIAAPWGGSSCPTASQLGWSLAPCPSWPWSHPHTAFPAWPWPIPAPREVPDSWDCLSPVPLTAISWLALWDSTGCQTLPWQNVGELMLLLPMLPWPPGSHLLLLLPDTHLFFPLWRKACEAIPSKKKNNH